MKVSTALSWEHPMSTSCTRTSTPFRYAMIQILPNRPNVQTWPITCGMAIDRHEYRNGRTHERLLEAE